MRYLAMVWLGLAACGGPSKLSEGGPAMAAEAGAIAKEISADPDKRADVLAAHGATDAAFEQSLYAIAADPALTADYEAARK